MNKEADIQIFFQKKKTQTKQNKTLQFATSYYLVADMYLEFSLYTVKTAMSTCLRHIVLTKKVDTMSGI